MVGTVVKCPSRPIRESPPRRPSTAETIGIPIATSVPKVKARMIIAAVNPTISLLSVAGSESSLPICPLAATFIPALRAGSAASRYDCASSCVISEFGTLRSTAMNAVLLSLLICA